MQHPPSHLARNVKHPSLSHSVLPPAVQSPPRAPSKNFKKNLFSHQDNDSMIPPTLCPTPAHAHAYDLRTRMNSQLKILLSKSLWLRALNHAGSFFPLSQSTSIKNLLISSLYPFLLPTSLSFPSPVPVQHPPSHLARNNKHPSLRRRVLPPAVQSPRRAPFRHNKTSQCYTMSTKI